MTTASRQATSISAILGVLVLGLVFAVTKNTAGDQEPTKTNFVVAAPHSAARGLKAGMPVQILGKKAGQLEGMDYAPDGSGIELTIKIEPDQLNRIVSSSRIGINRDSAETTLEIFRDPQAARGENANSPIAAGTPLKFSDDLPAEKSSPRSVFKTIASFLPNIKLGIEEATEFMTYVGADADQLMGDVSDLVNVDAKELVADLDEITKSLKTIVARTDSMMTVLETELQDAPGTMREIRQLLSETGCVVNQAGSVMCQTGEMVDTLRNRPLIRRMVNRNQRRQCR